MAESKAQLQRTVKEMRKVLDMEATAVAKLVELEAILARRMPWEEEDERGARRADSDSHAAQPSWHAGALLHA